MLNPSRLIAPKENNYKFLQSYSPACINKLIENKILLQEVENCFYVCKVSNQDFSSLGLISSLPTALIEKNIFFHEEISETKIKKYTSCLNKNRMQLNPVILVHENNEEVEKYLNKIIVDSSPSLTIEAFGGLYEFWKIPQFEEMKEMYSKISQFLIADGNHRIASFKNISEINFFLAFLISRKNLFSKEVYRKYKNLNSEQKEKCLNFFHSNFGLSPASHVPQCLQDFIIIDGEKKFIVNKSSNKISQLKILNFLNKNIGFDDENNLNFSHSKIDHFQNDNINDFEILIPKLRLGKNLIHKKPYPPHSSWFEPKIPDGLISMIL